MGLRCSTLWAPAFAAAIQDAEFVGPAGTMLLVAVRNSNYLRKLNLETLQVGCDTLQQDVFWSGPSRMFRQAGCEG